MLFMQPHDFEPRRYVLAAIALLALIGFVALLGTYKPSITGAFIVGNQYFSNAANITADNTAEVVTASLPFEPADYRPLDTSDCNSIYVETNGNQITNYNLTPEIENGVCKNLNITVANQIYNSTNETSIAYRIYFGKSLQRISFASPTPEDGAAITGNSTTIMAGLSLSGVAQLEWNGNTEPMTGNGSAWWSEKANLANGNYTFRVLTGDVTSETRTIEINYVPQQPQQNQNETNTSAWISFVSPTPANNSVLPASTFTVAVNASSPPVLELKYNNITANHTLTLNETWQKTFENKTNGIYLFKAISGNLGTETRTIQINYTAPAPPKVKDTDMKFSVENVPPAKDVTFVVHFRNTGNTELTEVSGSVDVYQAGNFLQTLDLGKVGGTKPGEEGQLSASWVAAEFDFYYAEAKVGWDGGSKPFNINFTVGEPTIEITKLTREQASATSATLAAELANRWIEEIKDVSVKFNIYKDGAVIKTLDAEKQDIGAKASKTFSASHDTEDIQAVRVEAVASYGDKSAVSSLEAAKTQSVEQPTEAAKPAGKLAGFSVLTGAFAKLAEPKNKKISIIASAIISALIISALVFARKPKDPKAEYMKEYSRRVKGWQDYYAHHQQSK